MPGKILLRCAVCGKFHAAYLVNGPGVGKKRVCYTCWKANYAAQPVEPPGQEKERPEDRVETGTTGLIRDGKDKEFKK